MAKNLRKQGLRHAVDQVDHRCQHDFEVQVADQVTDELDEFAAGYLSRFLSGGQCGLTSAQHRLTLYMGYSIGELRGDHGELSGHGDRGMKWHLNQMSQETLGLRPMDKLMLKVDDGNRSGEVFGDDEQRQRLDDVAVTEWPERSHSSQECNCLVNTLPMVEI